MNTRVLIPIVAMLSLLGGRGDAPAAELAHLRGAPAGIAAYRATGPSDAPLLPGVPHGPAMPLPPGGRKEERPATDPVVPDGSRLSRGTGAYRDMVLIPAGTFEMGSSDGKGRLDERPLHTIYLKDFYIALHEVTAEQYCEFLNKEGDKSNDGTSNGTPRIKLDCLDCPVVKVGKRFKPRAGFEERPMVCMSWFGAADYAQWAGGRLPTSAEWEKAALLTTPQQPGDYLSVLGRKESVPVTIAEPGVLGVTGMVGNVWEWCSDWYDREYYGKSPVNNPSGPNLGKEKEIRGGSWASVEASKRIRNRHRAAPTGCYRTVGLRIVKD
jgi:formylglycine-generating enzyme